MNTTAAPQSVQTPDAGFFTAADIARAVSTPENKVHKKMVLRTAQRENWPSHFDGYRWKFQPPAMIADIIIAQPAAPADTAPAVKFADLAHSDAARQTVLWREEAVKLFHSQKHVGCEVAYETCAAIMRINHAGFKCTSHSLRLWVKDYTAHGIDGLVDQKRGRVGRKAFVNDLEESQLLKLAADAVGAGNWKRNNARARVNKAEAFRNLVSDPTVTGPARSWLHGGRASKSALPPSVSKAIDQRVSPLTATLMQVGAKAAKLDGGSVECNYDNVPAGDAFTADDMTANVYVWVEWPNEQGFLLIRPQILAAADIGSMSWLNVRAVMRPKGQYNKDDVWGLIGDVFDDFGLFKIAVLEGGIWQSNVVAGQKVVQKNSFADEQSRFGGLQSLGVKLMHTRTPRGKIIETMFNTLQHAADNVRGFCGRDERKDCPEDTKRNLAQVEAGHAHPRQYFLHLSEYNEHLRGVMNALNNTRADGKILRGLCPLDKWSQDTAGIDRVVVPDNSKWMYRAAYRVVEVTRNGVRITVGSGKYMTAYNYFSEQLEVHRGRRVVVFWNDNDPDTDAVVYTIQSGKPDKMICVAPRVPDAPRFGATDEQMAAASTHKKLQMQLARTQRASLAPYFKRNFKTGAARQKAAEVNDQLRAVRSEQGKRIRSRQAVQEFQGDVADLLSETNLEPNDNKTTEHDAETVQRDGAGASGNPESLNARPPRMASSSRLHKPSTSPSAKKNGKVTYVIKPPKNFVPKKAVQAAEMNLDVSALID